MQECRAGQERKDRAEIEALRTEVSDCRQMSVSI